MYAPGATGEEAARQGLAGCMAENPLRFHRPTTKTRSRSVKSYLALPLKAAGQPVISIRNQPLRIRPGSCRRPVYPCEQSHIQTRLSGGVAEFRNRHACLGRDTPCCRNSTSRRRRLRAPSGCVIGRCDKSAKLFTAGVGEPVEKDRGVVKVFAGLVWEMTARLRKMTVTRPACFLFIATFVSRVARTSVGQRS